MSRYIAVAENLETDDMFAVGPYNEESEAIRTARTLIKEGYHSYLLRLEWPPDVTGGELA